MRFLRPGLAVVGALAALTIHCGTGAPPGGDAIVTVTGPATPDGSAQQFDPTMPDAGTENGCSADLHSIVDAKGEKIADCPADQGCAKGLCVPACDAAAASHGTLGCDFVFSTPAFNDESGMPCFAVFLANAWGKPARVAATYGKQALDPTQFGRVPDGSANAAAWPALPASGVPVGQVGVLFMSSAPGSLVACPVQPAVPTGTAAPNMTAKGTAFHLRTDFPVNAYDILPFGGAASFLPGAQLLLPTSAWGNNYVAAVPPLDKGGPNGSGPQWAHIIAAEDNTTIKIVPTVALPPDNMNAIPRAAPGVLRTFTLNANEFIQWEPCKTLLQVPCAEDFPNMDLSGSVIQSDKPVALMTGNAYLCTKSATSPNYGGCDSDHELIPPVSALGWEYVAAPFATRRADMEEESIPYRIVGAVDLTSLTYDPPVLGAPGSLQKGQVVDFEAKGPFVVRSQGKGYPFYVAQLMPGGLGLTRPGITTPLGMTDPGLGDEEYVNLLPPAQFLRKYVFFTDPTYGTTNLAVTRTKTPNGFADVTVDCIGKLTGFRPVGASGRYEVANVDLRRVNDVGACKSGLHVAESEGSFGVVVWGVDTYASYAYPAGGNAAVINQIVVPPVPK